MTGRLVLVSTPIGNLGDLPPRAIEALSACALICCEDTRHSGKLLSHAGVSGVRLAVADEHREVARTDEVLGLLAAGSDVGVITDAGTPGISDPGMRLVAAAVDSRARGHGGTRPGGTGDGTGAQRVRHHPVRVRRVPAAQRAGAQERIADVAAERRTVVLYEAPHRVARTVADLAAACGPTDEWRSPASSPSCTRRCGAARWTGRVSTWPRWHPVASTSWW